MTLQSTETTNAATTEVARLAYLSLHTADPGGTGGSEATGGSPAYARQLNVWGTAAGGVCTGAQLTFQVPPGTYGYYGFWSAATGGTWLGGGALDVAQSPSTQAVLQVTPKVTVTAS